MTRSRLTKSWANIVLAVGSWVSPREYLRLTVSQRNALIDESERLTKEARRGGDG